MPPEGLRSRKPAIGDVAPSGSSSSILVLGSVTNTTVTPCAGCAIGSDTSAPSTARYWAVAAARLGTAMATWLRRPIMLSLPASEERETHPSARLRQQHLGDGALAPGVLHGGADGAAHGLAYQLAVPAA